MGQRGALDIHASEKQIEAGIIQLGRALGLTVVKFSQPRHTMQTGGIPDLRVYWPNGKLTRAAWVEVKKPNGIQTIAQQAFQHVVERAGERYVIGGMCEFIELLEEWGVIREGDVSPKGEPWKAKRD